MSGDTVSGYLDELPEGWVPVEEYIQPVPHATMYACFYFTGRESVRTAFQPR